jgi:hypothetical protein
MLLYSSVLSLVSWPSVWAQANTAAGNTASRTTSVSSDQKAAELLVSARNKIRTGEFAQAQAELKLARPLISDALLRVIWSSLNVELNEAKALWSEAAFWGASALRDYSTLVGTDQRTMAVIQWNSSVRDLFFRTVKNNLQAGLVLEAFALVDKRRSELSREMLLAQEEVVLKKLSDELRRVDREVDAQAVEKIIFRNYPFVSQALREMLTPDTRCRLDEEFSNLKDKRSAATTLIQRLGAHDDLRQFAYSLMGLPNALRLINLPVDSLSGPNKSELLDLVEWLHSVREYNHSYEITSRLIQSQSFEPPFTRERLHMLHARALNGVHRPVEAAAFYRGLILQYPQTDIANTARPRYVLSLHYAQKYTDVAREAATLSGLLKPRDVAWRTFWARYLSKQYTLAITSTEHEQNQDQRARIQYWRGRAYESEGLHREANEAFKRVPFVDNPSYYGLFSSWRTEPAPVQPVSVQRPGVALAAKKLPPIHNEEISMLRTQNKLSARNGSYGTLISGGFGHIMRGPLRKRLQTLGASGTELAEWLVQAGDAHASVQFASNQRRIVGNVPVGRSKEWKGFVDKNKETMKLLYPLPYTELVAEAAENLRISPWLILSIMRAESLFQPTVVSNVGARGLMQIMPTSGARIAELSGYPDFEPGHLDRPEVSIGFGAWYLARLLDYYRGNLPLAIAAYNAGPDAVDRWLERNSGMSLDEFLEDIPFDQTRKYVATVLTNMEIYSRLYSGGVKGISVNMFVKLPKPREDLEMF